MEHLLKLLEYIDYNLYNNYFLFLLCAFFFMFIHSSFSLPGSLILIASNGYFFGLLIGYIISILAITFGSFIFFIFFSVVLKNNFTKIYNKYVNKIDKYTSDNLLEYIIILRLIPGSPLLLQNIILSVLKIKRSTFLFTSLIGFTPIVFIAVFFGNQLNNLLKINTFKLADILSIEYIVFLILVIIIIVIKILFKKKN